MAHRRTRIAVAGALALALTVGSAGIAAAKISIRPERREFYAHARLPLSFPEKIIARGATFELTNEDETYTIASATVAPGCVVRGTKCRFVDRDAKRNREGLAIFRMSMTTGKIWLRSYSDLSAATPEIMAEPVKFLVSIPREDPSLPPEQASVTATYSPWHGGWILRDRDWPY